jgi:hypothetical protein
MKIRKIHVHSNGQIQWGLSVPEEIAKCYSGIHFVPILEKDRLILQSGCSTYPMDEELINYEYEDCIISEIK